MKKVNKASLIRQYLNANPEAKAQEIAKKFKVEPSYVHQIKYSMKATITKNIEKHMDNINAINRELAYKAGLGRNKIRMQASFDREPPTITMEEPKADPVNHPSHYKTGGIETIDFIEAKELGYHLGNVIKYVTRAKHKGNELEDLKKAQWYLERAIMKLHI
jgi:hypothetical protein